MKKKDQAKESGLETRLHIPDQDNVVALEEFAAEYLVTEVLSGELTGTGSAKQKILEQ
jgi:hypothetical protein